MSAIEQTADASLADLVPSTEAHSDPTDGLGRLDGAVENFDEAQAVAIPQLELAPQVETEAVTPEAPRLELPPGTRAYIGRFKRLTGILGMALLIAGLIVWRFKPHSQDRLALLIFVFAMFLAILHHYSLEEDSKLKAA